MSQKTCASAPARNLSYLFGLFAMFGAVDANAQMLALTNEGTQKVRSTSEQPPHALGVRARWVTAPGWELAPYTDAHTQLNGGWSVGLEYLHLRQTFDVVVSLDYSWVNPDSGNYLGKGRDPTAYTYFLAFDRLSTLSADVSIVGHWNLTPWMEFRLGAGLGLGVLFGNIYQIGSNPNCTVANAGDLSVCYPKTQPPRAPYDVKNPLPESNSPTVYCNADLSDSTADTAKTPCLRRVGGYPFNGRVVPVLNTLLGFRFRMHRNAYLHVETGWRLVGFYLGGGPEFRF